MVIYWLIFVVFAAAALLKPEKSKERLLPEASDSHVGLRPDTVSSWVVALSLIIIVGLRFEVGGDWFNYLQVYRTISDDTLADALRRSAVEPAYALLNWVSARVHAGMWLVNVVSCIPFIAGISLLSRQQENRWLALLIATPFLIIVVGMGYTRQATALGFLMIGCAQFVKTQSIRRFFCWILIGGLFHQSVLLFGPLILMAAGQKRLMNLFFGLMSAVIGFYTLFPTALERYTPGYIATNYNASGSTIRVAMNIVPAALILLSGNNLHHSYAERVIWRTLAWLAVFAAVALPLVPSSVIIDRLSIYLIPLQMFAFSRLPYSTMVGKSGPFWRFLLTIYTGVVLFVWLNFAVNAGAWLPYRNYLTSAFEARR